MGRVDWTDNSNANKGHGEGYKPGEIDNEVHTLTKFMRMLDTGQPMALELIFAPDNLHMATPHAVWENIIQNRSKFLMKNTHFMGYLKAQAGLYADKQPRAKAAREARDILVRLCDTFGDKEKLMPHIDMIAEKVATDHVRREDIEGGAGRPLAHLRIAGKRIPGTVPLSTALTIANKAADSFSERSHNATAGRDAASLSHALRIGLEAVEYYEKGTITLPRPEAEYLVAIKTGKADMGLVENDIMDVFNKASQLQEDSLYPDKADQEFIDNLIMDAHEDIVLKNNRERAQQFCL